MYRNKIWLPAITMAVLVTVLVFCSNKKFAAGDSLLVKVTNILKQEHYSSPVLDDEFSKKAFSNVLDKLDDDKRFFIQADYDFLKKYETSIDDQIKAGRFDFFDTAWGIFQKKLDVIEQFVAAELDQPYDFKGNDNYTVRSEVEKYAAGMSELRKNWSEWLKYQTLDRLYRKLESQKKKPVDDDTLEAPVKANVPYDTLELKSRNETKKFIQDWFKRWRKMDRRDQVAFYVNCITEIYDPHTNYFPPENKQNFDITMTGKLEGIGATLTERDGYIKVERIVPGSASYKQGDLKAGDLIIKVAQGAEEPVDVVDMKLDDAIQLIRGKKGTEVRLTVKKPDGSIKIIPIIRDVVVIEETYARSAVIDFDGAKYGLIHLPSFYADFSQRERGRHSSEDVRLEIEKLKKEGVAGIIMDLRYNGGGSLIDAIDMAGLFIKTGPVVQVRDPDGDVHSGADANPEQAWDGPLVLLTNTYSASASEILAAAMQDYKRAVVVGSKSTFGKGTVQTFVPIQGGRSTEFPLGFGQLKVTVQKFYRINGGTTQLRGVIPDVILPDLYDGIEQGESEMDFHMPYDKIKPADYLVYNGNFTGKMASAVSMVNKKVEQDAYFKNVQKQSKELKKMRESYTWSLNIDKYREQQQELREQNKKFEDSGFRSAVEKIEPLQADIDEVGTDEVRKAQRTDWLKPYRKDPGLNYAVLLSHQLKG